MATSRSPPRGSSQSAALFRAADAGRARVRAVFGGQGNTEDYFSELRGVWDAHPHLIEDLLARGSETLKSLVQNVEGSQSDLYSKGLDVRAWLQDPDSTPASEYMLTAPVSVPLIGLTQLLQFTAVCKSLEFTPGEFWQRSAGITGHSQGIVIAAAIATAHSWESFIDAAVWALRILFWIGYRTQLAFPREAILPSIVADSIKHGEGPPTPMMAISDLSQAQVERAIDEINVHLAEDKRLFVSLVNGSRNIVVSGPPMSLHGLAVRLRSKNVPGSQDQSRTPFSKRKESFQLRYLPITVPFHSSYLLGASFAIEEDLRDIKLEPKALRVPVYDTKTGMDLRRSTADDLVPELVRMITLDRVDWPRVISFPHATHIIDFGPGGVSGAGMLAHKIKEGTGVRVLIAGATDGLSNDLGYQSEILSRDEDVKFGVNWSEKFKPRLVKTAAGVTYIDTKMSRLLGLPPIMVAGMTPSTVPWDFVAATMNANYHIELAGGGYYNPKTMTAALVKIQNAVQPGRGICVNLIFANPAAMQWQIPMIRDLQMGGTGASIAGMTIGAGVPSPEIVNGYIETLGLQYIGFKPGSVGTIQRVIDIARAHPDFPIMLQWTGGRGGGHHSYEDFHQPILQTYGAIRKCDNIILVAGSGFGGSEDTYPYLNGSWSEVLGYPTMPFDGCLFGSRVMTAKEAHTSKAAKQAIVNAKGVADAEWEKTYEGPAGGIITVRSEMGEPLHTLATRGMIFWSEMDKTIFSLERAKRVAALTKRREYIIRNLNANFQKPWFGDVRGEAADLQDMTYGQIVRRMVQLLFVKHQSRWIDQSYKRLVGDFLRRVEERLARSANQLSLLACYSDLDEEPQETIDIILKAYPGAEEQLINGEDAQYFLQLCQRPGQKPVPFIPVLDDNFETWFKKDSLWQSEDLEAVVDQDVGRTSILQGPVAVKYSTVIDEPIKDILDRINTDHIRFLTEELYNGDSDVIPISDYFFGNDVRELPSNDQYTATEQNDGTVTYALPLASALPLPSPKAWLQLLAGSSRSSRYALFMSDKIIQDVCQQNPYRRIFTPRRGIRVTISHPNDAARTRIRLEEEIEPNQFALALEIRMGPQNRISVDIIAQKTASGFPAALNLYYTYHPKAGFAPIREVMHDRNDRINTFYRQCWFSNEDSLTSHGMDEPVQIETMTIDSQDIEVFMRAINNNRQSSLMPMAYAIKLAWRPIMKCLFTKAIRGDLLKLVHLSNTYTTTPGGPQLKVGQKVDVAADIVAILNQESGKVVSVRATVMLDGKSAMEIKSEFFYRGSFEDFENTVEKKVETPRELVLESAVDVVVLKSKNWIQLEDPNVDLLGMRLVFRLESTHAFKAAGVYSSIRTSGSITVEVPSQPALLIGTVDFSSGVSHGNEVMDYLDRFGVVIEQPIELTHPIPLHGANPLSIKVPASNAKYASSSADFNPIHVSPVFSTYANLPGTITHGMYVSSVMQGLVETYAAENDGERVKRFQASFTGMVLPEDELEVELFHTAMIDGHRVIKVEAKNKETNKKVFSGEAKVAPPATLYIFAGQGSQEVGMGMDLYATSAAARRVWDEADRYLSDTYGFLITDIVRKNPKRLTVYFRGRRGRLIRENYRKMAHDVYDANGTISTKKLFPHIDEFTTSHTYSSLMGLLFSTQFTQPALAIAEKASIADMRSKGLIAPESIFAGHSLGEYSALAAMAEIIPSDRLISIVFYRGLTMQHALERDAAGRSNFAMVAVDPSRISPTFTEAALRYVVDSIVRTTGEFLEIVNFNVEGKQYVCTGNLPALDCLMVLTNTLKSRNIDLVTFMAIMSRSQLNETFDAMVTESFSIVAAKPKPLTLQRGSATIPLPGIDLPFHSSYFIPRLNSFRNALVQNIDERSIRPESLIGKYVPNLTAKPFSIEKEYFEEVYKLTGSEMIKAVLENWEEEAVTVKTAGIRV